jgi:hypothetical protein
MTVGYEFLTAVVKSSAFWEATWKSNYFSEEYVSPIFRVETSSR